MKKFISIFCVLSPLVFATETSRNQAAIDSVAESINSRKGIEISGTVRSVSYTSNVSSKQEKMLNDSVSINQMPDKEIAEFVQLDLDFLFRPWDNVSANLKLRLGAGMQEYFANSATLVSVPWLSIQGNAADGKFHWIVGDFRQLYSPLTLYAPSTDILYEPIVFARKREIAMGDALLEGNKRNLQGFNLQFRPDFGETFGELRIEALGSRLRRAGFLDSTGAMGNILPNENIPGSSQAATFDKFLIGGNVEFLPLNRNILVGGSYLTVFDEKRSVMKRPNGTYINKNDTLPQSTQVFAGRIGFDLAGILNKPWLVANAVAEYAGSSDNIYERKDILDENDNPIGVEDVDKFVDGKALLVSLDVGYKDGPIKAVLSGNFITNDSAWFNPLAQTPQFLPRRILNSDKDGGFNKYGVYSPLYSTFDALYNFTPKHSPMGTNLKNANPAQTQSYNISPYAKSSWNAATFTRAELALMEELSDMNLQLALPSGLATTNRTGTTGTLTLGYGDYIEAKGLFTNLKQSSAISESAKPAVYTEFGGGAKIDIFGLIGFSNPMEISGSYKHSQKEQTFDDDDYESGKAKVKFSSDFINGGLYWRFFRRFGLTCGYQRINSDLNSVGAELVKSSGAWKVKILPVVKSTQDQWMAGLDYTLTPHAWLSINYGMMNVENTYDVEGYVTKVTKPDRWVITGTNLPDYLVASVPEDAEKLKHKFSRSMLEAAINVEF
jgi:hypothetical protein